MELEEFSEKVNKKVMYLNIHIDNMQIIELYKYMQLLIEWNKKMNLTAIVEPDEIIVKHFIDSLTINKYILQDTKLIDIGTGAGFPGVPLKVMNKGVSISLLDSLKKRVLFLEEVIEKLKLEDIKAIHNRAEDLGKDREYRQQYDYATSRAVAPLNYLLEYMLPFVKKGGACICMKGLNIEDEIVQAEDAILELGGKIENIEKIKLPETNIERNIIIVKKLKDTPNKYPRKAGIPKKQPISK